jgi:hypothetical protein
MNLRNSPNRHRHQSTNKPSLTTSDIVPTYLLEYHFSQLIMPGPSFSVVTTRRDFKGSGLFFPLTLCKAWYERILRILCQKFPVSFRFKTAASNFRLPIPVSVAPLLRCCSLYIRFDHIPQSIINFLLHFTQLRKLEIRIDDYKHGLLEKSPTKHKRLLKSVLNIGRCKRVLINLLVYRRNGHLVVKLNQFGQLDIKMSRR